MQQTPSLQFPPPPPFTKKVLIFLLGLYIVELLAQNWIAMDLSALLAWNPGQGLSRPWQIFTHFFFQGRSPFSTLFELIAIYFFLPTIQRSFGKKGAYRLFAYTVISTAIFGIFCLTTGAVNKLTPAMIYPIHCIVFY